MFHFFLNQINYLLPLFAFLRFQLMYFCLHMLLLFLYFLGFLLRLLQIHNNLHYNIQHLRRLLRRLIHLVNLFEMLIIILILLLYVLLHHLLLPCNRMSPFQNLLHYIHLLFLVYYNMYFVHVERIYF